MRAIARAFVECGYVERKEVRDNDSADIGAVAHVAEATCAVGLGRDAVRRAFGGW